MHQVLKISAIVIAARSATNIGACAAACAVHADVQLPHLLTVPVLQLKRANKFVPLQVQTQLANSNAVNNYRWRRTVQP